MSDKYDEAVAYLQQNPGAIREAWHYPYSVDGGILFQYCGDKDLCGCLTQIRGGGAWAATDSLTERIRADERIPERGDDITVESLPVFAEWQRIVDKELGRE